MKKFILLIIIFTCASVFADDRVVNRQGVLTKDGTAVLGMLEQYVVPQGWSVFFEDDDFRTYSVDWSKGVNWHDAMNSFGASLHLSVIVDGATKKVYFSAPSAGFREGVHVLNSASLAYSANRELQDILRRGEVNYQRYEARTLGAQLAEAEREKQRITKMLDDIESQRESLKRELTAFEIVTKKVPQRMEVTSTELSEPIQNPEVKSQPVSQVFSFEVYRGLLVADNLRRFADQIGYQLHLINVPRTCDFEVVADETLKGEDRLKMFRDYANRFFFDVTYHEPASEQPLVALNYIGDRNVFKGCAR